MNKADFLATRLIYLFYFTAADENLPSLSSSNVAQWAPALTFWLLKNTYINSAAFFNQSDHKQKTFCLKSLPVKAVTQRQSSSVRKTGWLMKKKYVEVAGASVSAHSNWETVLIRHCASVTVPSTSTLFPWKYVISLERQLSKGLDESHVSTFLSLMYQLQSDCWDDCMRHLVAPCKCDKKSEKKISIIGVFTNALNEQIGGNTSGINHRRSCEEYL